MNKSKRILLVDEDAEVAWRIGRYLTRDGFSVVTCSNGAEAVDLLGSRKFDVLITDIQIPHLCGVSLIDWARREKPDIQVVAITSVGSASMRQVILRKGAVLYLEKPVDLELLIEFLRSAGIQGSFTGNIREIDLFDYIQLIIMTRRRELIEIFSQNNDIGRIYIDNGNVLHAICGELKGEKAFYYCLSFSGGSFSTLSWRDPEEVTIENPGDYLLMEAACKKDEAIPITDTLLEKA